MSTKEKAIDKLLEEYDIKTILNRRLDNMKNAILENTYPDEFLEIVSYNVVEEENLLEAVHHAVLTLAETWYNENRKD